MRTFDLIVIGGGSAGFVAALKAKEAGWRVALMEKHKLGGECPNYACLPSKALLKSAEVLWLAEHADRFGIVVDGVRADFKAMMSSKDKITTLLTGSPRLENMLARSGITHLHGIASFVNPTTIAVDGQEYATRHVVIATGSDPFIPPIPGLKETGYLTSIDASLLDHLPPRIAIIGAGPVGCEYAQIFIRLHSQVWLIQRGERILDREDEETSAAIQTSFVNQGVHVLTKAEVTSARTVQGGKVLTVVTPEGRQEIIVDDILVVPGRRPDLSALQLEKAGVAVDGKGKLVLNEHLQTSQPHIWAAGDAAGRMLFTHVAAYEGDIVGWNLLHPEKMKKPEYRVVPRVTFTWPEVASVGLTEAEAKANGRKVVATSYPLKVMGRGLTARETEGFIKLVVDAATEEILGGHMVGSNAGEVIHEIALAMHTHTQVSVLATMIHAFPTMAESISFVTERLLSQRDKLRGAV